jgi:hypothetical protein
MSSRMALPRSFLGDDTAWWLGRVSFNSVKLMDPFATVLLPGPLLLIGVGRVRHWVINKGSYSALPAAAMGPYMRA